MEEKSTIKIIAGCVGALDCFFKCTKKPTKTEVPKQISYYSRHYESFGLNCQAIADSRGQFLDVSPLEQSVLVQLFLLQMTKIQLMLLLVPVGNT